MKYLIILATTFLSLQAFANQKCDSKIIFDLSRNAVNYSIEFSDSPEAPLDCSTAYIDYLYNGSPTAKIDTIDVPVILTQSFTEEQVSTINASAVLDACMKNLYVFSMVIEGPVMTLRSVHVKYKEYLD